MRRRPLSYVCLLLILLIFLGTVTGMTGRTDKEWDEKGCTLTGRVYDKEWVTGEEEKKIVYLEIREADNASGMEDAEKWHSPSAGYLGASYIADWDGLL